MSGAALVSGSRVALLLLRVEQLLLGVADLLLCVANLLLVLLLRLTHLLLRLTRLLLCFTRLLPGFAGRLLGFLARLTRRLVDGFLDRLADVLILLRGRRSARDGDERDVVGRHGKAPGGLANVAALLDCTPWRPRELQARRFPSSLHIPTFRIPSFPPQLTQLAARILIADDQPDVLQALRLLLKGEGFVVESVSSPVALLRAIDAAEYDAALIDLNYTRDTTSGREGLTLLATLRTLDPTLSVIVMTAWGSVESAVEAIQLGARDYVEKPWDNERLLATLRTQVELTRALRATRRLAAENQRLRGTDARPTLVAESRAMQEVVNQLERIAPSEANVLITGEHGTGKDVVARWLHAASSRADRPLVTVNAGGIADSLFESELFGHVKGAFTDAKSDRVGSFELADGGTLFLDEIANVSPKQQAKLLRVLESGDLQRVGSSRVRRVDVRVFAASNADLRREVSEGRFREDLLYRLNTVQIHLPPLRARREDIPELAALFLREQATRYRKHAAELTPGAMRALLEHGWPGNVRELRHAVERAVLMARGSSVTEDDLGLKQPHAAASPSPGELSDDLTLEGAERLLIQRALARHSGNVSRAAEALGVSRSALYRRLQYYGL